MIPSAPVIPITPWYDRVPPVDIEAMLPRFVSIVPWYDRGIPPDIGLLQPSLAPIPPWYDRTPITVSDVYSATIIPHNETTRLTYAVPAGKSAFLEFIQTASRRSLVASVMGLVRVRISLNLGGVGDKVLIHTQLYNNTLYTIFQRAESVAVFLGTGDTITFKTFDNSIGGSIEYLLSYKLTLFTK